MNVFCTGTICKDDQIGGFPIDKFEGHNDPAYDKGPPSPPPTKPY